MSFADEAHQGRPRRPPRPASGIPEAFKTLILIVRSAPTPLSEATEAGRGNFRGLQ
jgi:hypothetical protein